MFHFSKLELVHWDYWQRVTIPLDARIVTVVGPNGSGKTTLLDALRTLLATKCSAKREYKRYVRRNGAAFSWLRAVVDNRRAGGGRHPHPFWPLMDDEVTVACRIRKQGGDWLRQYAIEAGDVSIETLENQATWLGVEDYRRRLESAGLSKAIVEVLALEQGDTDKLCEYSPKELLNLVFHVFGDKEVLDAYLQAKSEQKEAERELKDMEGDLARLDMKLQAAIDRANRYLQWQKLKDDQIRLNSEILPRMEVFELQDAVVETEKDIARLQHLQSEKQATVQRAEAEHATIQERLASAQSNKETVDAAYATAQTEFQNATYAVRDAQKLLKDRDRLVDLTKASKDANTVAIAESISRNRDELARAKISREGCETRRRELNATIAALASGQSMPPEFVRAYRHALNEENISHCMLSEIVEVAEPAWQGAVEALLQPYRHIVLLDRSSDREAAWRIAERLRYRHFVVADRKPLSKPLVNSVLEIVDFKQDAPDWLVQLLNRTRRVENASEGGALPREQDWITREGYHRERRGGRFIGVSSAEFHFGEAARKEQLAALQLEAKALEQKLHGLNERINHLQHAISEEQALLTGVDAAEMLAARNEEFIAVESRLPALERNAQDAGEVLATRLSERDDMLSNSGTLQAKKSEAAKHIEELKREFARLVSELASHLHKQTEQRELLQEKTKNMPAHWLDAESLQILRTEHHSKEVVEIEIKKIEERLTEGEWETDPFVVNSREKLKIEVESVSEEVQRRKGYYGRAENLAHDARGAYINVLRATVKRYAKNLRNLGELAGIEVQIDPPELANDDLTLAQAGLVVRFNFDKKGLMGLNDGEASGGQQVMKSLILLVALMMDEDRPGGFVFIDEPFAHLDIFNIDRVSTFLQATKAQYLITTPNTHNINVFNPTELTLVTRKKQPDDRWAQPVAVVRRMASETV